MANALGLSIGATQLVATPDDPQSQPVVRSSILTLHEDGPPEVGVPSQPGLTLTGFVGRVGDPVGIVAADGSVHRAEWALTEAMRVLIADAVSSANFTAPPVLSASIPAHWSPQTVSTLRDAIDRVPAFAPGGRQLKLIPDARAALEALAAGPGTPDRGVVVVCDLGGSGSSITLADAARGFQQIGQTIRFADFSGQQIDQMLLTQVLTDLNQDPEGTTSVGALTRLRDQCRLAKERLSGDTATSVPVQLPGITTDVRLTRAELEGHLRGPLSNLINAIQDTVERNGIHPANITAVASVGGGASIPLVTQQLSERMRVPVITAPQPQLAAARGVALLATRPDLPPQDATAMRPVEQPPGDATMMRPVPTGTGTFAAPVAAAANEEPELAWSQDDSAPDLAPLQETGYQSGYTVDLDDEYQGPTEATTARPELRFSHGPYADEDDYDDYPPLPWYRRPLVWFIAAAAVAGIAFTGMMVSLTSSESPAPATTTPSVNVVPSTGDAPAEPPPSPEPPPPPQTHTVTQSVQPPPPSPEPPPPPPPTTTTTTTPPRQPPPRQPQQPQQPQQRLRRPQQQPNRQPQRHNPRPRRARRSPSPGCPRFRSVRATEHPAR
ncbi:Hsp70 family protein [Mycobacteroides abscessus subsp. abscessus]